MNVTLVRTLIITYTLGVPNITYNFLVQLHNFNVQSLTIKNKA